MKKKLLALLLVVVMIISIVPVTAFADELEARGPHGPHIPIWPWWPPMPEVHECEFVEVDRDEATCLVDGTIYYECKCGETDEEVIPATGHTPVVDPAVDATCTTPGKTEGSHCGVCGETIVAQEDTAVLDHTEVVLPAKIATCTETGLTLGKVCAVCETVLLAQEEVKALGHTEVVVEGFAPTCTKPGLTDGKFCSACKAILEAQKFIPATGHKFEVVKKTVKEATCTEKGVIECKSLCACGEQWGKTWYEFTDENGHDMVTDAAVAPTCTKPGLTEGSHCKNCNFKIVQKFVPANGHKFEIVKVTVKDPTCTEAGLKVAKWQCSVCNHQRGFIFGWDWWYEPIKALGHDEVTVEGVAPTCTENGISDHVECERCGDVLVEKEDIDPLGHNYDGSAHKEPTCTEKGFKEHTCTRCGDVTHYDVDELGHDVITIEGKAPTCTEEGATDHTECKRCGIVLTEKEPIEALGHDVIEIKGKDATCTEPGATDHTECKRCGIVLTEKEEIPAKGHTAKVVPAVAPTCEATGLTEGKVCSVCGEVLVKQEVVAAIGHAWDEGKITTPATEKADGVKTYTCKNDPTHTKTEAVKYVAPDKDLDEVPKTGDNSGVILATMTGVAMLAAVAYVFGKKRSVR